MTHVPGTNLFLLLNLVSGAPDDTKNEIQIRKSPVGLCRSGRNFRNENPCATRAGSAGVPIRSGFDVQTTLMSCMSIICASRTFFSLQRNCQRIKRHRAAAFMLAEAPPVVLCSSFVPSGLRVLGYHGDHSESRTAFGGCFLIRPCVFWVTGAKRLHN